MISWFNLRRRQANIFIFIPAKVVEQVDPKVFERVQRLQGLSFKLVIIDIRSFLFRDS